MNVAAAAKHAVMARLKLVHSQHHHLLVAWSAADLWHCQAAVLQLIRQRRVSLPASRYRTHTRCHCRPCSSTVLMQWVSSTMQSTRSGWAWWLQWTSVKSVMLTTLATVGQWISEQWWCSSC